MKAYPIIMVMFLAFFLSIGIAGNASAGETHRNTAAEDFTRTADLSDVHGPLGTHRNLTGALSGGLLRPDRGCNISRVLAVLGNKIDDRRVLEKVKYKLSGLPDTRMEMITSLSDHIGSESDTENTIAFFLLTTLIIFS